MIWRKGKGGGEDPSYEAIANVQEKEMFGS